MNFVLQALLCSITLTITILVIVALSDNFWVVAYSATTANIRRIGNHSVAALVGDGSSWNPDYWRSSQQYADTWRNKIPEIARMIQQRSIISDTSMNDTAIIHLRCSDVPFYEHPEYPLLPKAYYDFVASKLITDTGLRHVRVLNCFQHDQHPLARTKCPMFAQTIANWVQEKLPKQIDVSVKIECDDERTTISKLMGARWLISTGGSFSFIPGMLKGRKFITPILGPKTTRHQGLHRLVHWTMWPKSEIYETDNSFNYS